MQRSDFCDVQTGLASQKEETRETKKQTVFYSLVT